MVGHNTVRTYGVNHVFRFVEGTFLAIKFFGLTTKALPPPLELSGHIFFGGGGFFRALKNVLFS